MRRSSRTGWLAFSALLAVACKHDVPSGAASGRRSEEPPPSASLKAVASTMPATGAAGSVMVGAQSFSLAGPPMVAADYLRMEQALGTIEYDSYPKRADALFARMVAKDTYAFLARAELPIAQRFQSGFELGGAINQVGKRYLQALAKGALHRENLELQAMSGCVAAEMVPLTQAFVGGLDKADPKYATRMKGLDQVKAGLNDIARGALMSLRADGYGPDDRRWFAAAVLPCLVPIVAFVPDAERSERLGEAKNMALKEKDAEIRAALSALAGAK